MVTNDKYNDDEEERTSYVILQTNCIASEIEGKRNCNSSDAHTIYVHPARDGKPEYYDSTCFSCSQSFTSDQFNSSSVAKGLGIIDGVASCDSDFIKIPKKSKRPPLSKAEAKAYYMPAILFDKGGTDPNTKINYVPNQYPIKSTDVIFPNKVYRGIKPEYMKFYGWLRNYKKDGSPNYTLYPESYDDLPLPLGFTIRYEPKKGWNKVGYADTKAMLHGQIKFLHGGRDILIVGGQVDAASAYQMLIERVKKKVNGKEKEKDLEDNGDYAPTAVVSPTAGEGGSLSQIKRQYDFLDRFERIFIGLDNDTAGREAAALYASVLPKDKVRIVTWTGKDPNQMLTSGLARQFVSDFYNAKPLIDTGIIESSNLLANVKAELIKKKISLPPHMHRAQKMLKGGLRQGIICNIVGDTSVGKSTHVNDIFYHFLYHAPVRVGNVSLEMTAGAFGADILSIHLSKNLSWFENGQDAIDYLETPEISLLAEGLFTDDDGVPRWSMIDEKDGNIEILEMQIEKLIKKHDCRIIIIDVLTDIVRSLTNEQQAAHFMFQKRLGKQGITFINVMHTTKPPNTRTGLPSKSTEYDVYGSGTSAQSAAVSIILNRNKMAKCPIEANTTYIDLPKARNSTTGYACALYYDPDTRQVFDRDDYFSEHPDKLPTGFDLTISSFEPEYYNEDGSVRNLVGFREGKFKKGNGNGNSNKSNKQQPSDPMDEWVRSKSKEDF